MWNKILDLNLFLYQKKSLFPKSSSSERKKNVFNSQENKKKVETNILLS